MHQPRRALVVLLLFILPLAAALPAPANIPGPRPVALQDDCATGADAPDAQEDALLFASGGSCAGSTGPDDPGDWFAIDVEEGGAVAVTPSDATTRHFRWCAHRPDGTTAACHDAPGARQWTERDAAGGRWHVRVLGEDPTVIGSYWLQLHSLPPPPPPLADCGTTSDAGGDLATSLAFPSLPGTCGGQLEPSVGDLADWYAFEAPAEGTLQATLTLPSGSARLCLEDLGSARLQCSNVYGVGAVHLASAGVATWLVRVEQPSTDLSYTVALEVKTDADAHDDCGSGTDAGDALGHGLAVAPPVVCAGTWPAGSGDVVDFYSFPVSYGDVVVAHATTPTGWPTLCLWSGEDERVSCESDRYDAARLAWTAESGGTWHVQVHPNGYSAPTSYQLGLRVGHVDSASQDDCGLARDASHHAATPDAVAFPGQCAGEVGTDAYDIEDWYAFDLVAGEPFAARLEATQGDADLCVYAPGAETAERCSILGGSWVDRIEFTVNRTGTWRARVFTDTATGDYHLSLLRESSQDDCGLGLDAGDDFASAGALAPGVRVCEASFPQPIRDKSDWYQVHVEEGEPIVVEADIPPFFSMDLCLHRPDGTLVSCGARGGVVRVHEIADATGDWRIEARLRAGGGGYRMAMAIG